MQELNITLQGLTATQVKICELLWTAGDLDQCQAMIQNLPQEYQTEAQSLQQIIMQEVLELELDYYRDQAVDCINRYR
jgi:NAD(P)H-nitrite reductase large subunit